MGVFYLNKIKLFFLNINSFVFQKILDVDKAKGEVYN